MGCEVRGIGHFGSAVARDLCRSLMGGLLFGIWSVQGWGAQITVLLSDDGVSYHQAAQAIKSGLAGAPQPHVAVREVAGSLSPSSLTDSALVVALGVEAAQLAARIPVDIPVLAVLISRAAFLAILREEVPRAHRRNWSAIYLDQPWHRQIALIQALLPKTTDVGVVIGEGGRADLTALQEAVLAANMRLEAARTGSGQDVFGALRQVLRTSDVLLAYPDPEVINPNTLESLLIMSYRAGVPVLGYSRALVDAGVLAAVYSTPGQIGQQAAALARVILAGSRAQWQYPDQFDIAINSHVARSLGLRLPEAEAVRREIAEIESAL
jgi:putative tryptophan/tyrosine transport system substrate-binding protein